MNEIHPARSCPQCPHIARLEIPGGGQVTVDGQYAYVGHMKPPHGTTIIDVADPAHPKPVHTLMLPDAYSHSHKVRVAGDVMIVNVEQNNRHLMRRGARLPEAEAKLTPALSRSPTDAELAAELKVKANDIPALREGNRRGYATAALIYDTRTSPPRRIATKDHGFGGLASIWTPLCLHLHRMEAMSATSGDYDIERHSSERFAWWSRQHVAGGSRRVVGYKTAASAFVPTQLWARCARRPAVDRSPTAAARAPSRVRLHTPFPVRRIRVRVPFAVAGRQMPWQGRGAWHTPGQPHAGCGCRRRRSRRHQAAVDVQPERKAPP